MSFLKRIIDYFKPDPTRNWRDVPQRALTIILPDRTVNGTTFGHSFEALEIFGKPENEAPVYEKTFQFLKHGFIVDLQEEEKIDGYSFVFRNEPGENFTEARVSLVKADRAPFALSQETSEADITAFLGKPTSIDEDEDEIILFYGIDGLRLEWELTLTRLLKRLILYSSSNTAT